MDTLLLSLEEAARQLGGVSTRTVRRMIDSGELPKVPVRRSIKIPAAAVQQWVEKNMQAPHNLGVTRAGHCQLKENKQCHEKSKMEYTNARTRPTGGHRTPTQAAKELAAVLELPTGGKPKRS